MSAYRKPQRVTLADVAARAGVSVQTASQILAETKGVRIANATREKVRAAAIEVGYQPNRLAQAVRTGKTKIVSLWMPSDRPAITYLRVLNGLTNVMRGSGYELMVIGLDSDAAYCKEPRTFNVFPTDGIISFDAGRAIRNFRQIPQNERIPTVIIGAEEFDHADTVSWDVLGSQKSLVSRLISNGARRIVHLTPQWVIDSYPKEQRRTGYVEAMDEAGLPSVLIGSTGESASEAKTALLGYLNSAGTPEAVTAFTDTLALGAVRALSEKQIDCPMSCEVWGYGDYPEAADARIPISTLRVPIDELVGLAWQRLLERISDPDQPSRSVLLRMEPVKRASSK